MTEVLVIGGGLAGAAAALRLARAGREAVVLERERGPHDKVCGEFLSFEAQEELTDLGLDLEAMGAVPLDRVALAAGGRRSEAPLGFQALSLTRRVLDEALLDRAARAGAEVRRGARATGLARDGEGWAVEVGGETLKARTVLLATGKHDLRGWRRPPGGQDDLLGLKGYWRLARPGRLAGLVELHLFPGGYAGLQPVEGGRANLCLVVRRAAFAGLGGWDALLAHLLAAAPALAERLEGAEPCTDKPLAVASIPYGLVADRSEGLWRLGDQAAVIPSFTGEGMSLALHGARAAAEAILAGRAPGGFQASLARDLSGQVRRSTRMSKALVAPAGQALASRLAGPRTIGWALKATRIPASVRRRPSLSIAGAAKVEAGRRTGGLG